MKQMSDEAITGWIFALGFLTLFIWSGEWKSFLKDAGGTILTFIGLIIIFKIVSLLVGQIRKVPYYLWRDPKGPKV